jgi:hypothetical protein
MKISPKELSELSRAGQNRLGSLNLHHFLGGEQSRKNSTKLVEEGTHPFLGGAIQSKSNAARLKAGTHPSQIKMCCIHCKKETDIANFSRNHGDKCPVITGNVKRKQISRNKPGKSINKTVYTFSHKSGIIENCTRLELIYKYDLHNANISAILHKSAKTIKGWRVIWPD